jgi:hypothetical protein
MLNTIQRTKTVPPRRVLLYGEAGIGKSSWAAESEAPIFFDLEGGLGDLDVQAFPRPKTLQEFVQQVHSLRDGEHEFRTAVLDTVDWLEQLIEARVCEQHEVESLIKLDFGRGAVAVGEKWAIVLQELQDLVDAKGMQIIMLAHGQVEKVEMPDVEPFERFAPRMSKRGVGLLKDWATEIFCARLDFRTTTKKGDFGRERTTVRDLKERVIYTTPAPTHIAKQRIPMPSVLPLRYSAFAECVAAARRGIAPPAEQPAEQPGEQPAQEPPPPTPVLAEDEFPTTPTTNA